MNIQFHIPRGIALLALACAALSPAASASDYLGFDVRNALVPAAEILRGGPPRDGIPAIDRPEFIDPSRADHMHDSDLVLSLAVEKETRAYPLRILVWHEIVNDTIGGRPVAVTYCPLCGTAMVFDRRYNGRELTFGVSGLLYQSDVLMYDRQTESLWSQLGLKAVAGKMAGQELAWLPAEHLTWKAWRLKYPDGRVLSTRTGHDRDYQNLPYGNYGNSPRIMFPVPQTRTELPVKEWIAGVVVNGQARAYRLAALPRNTVIRDEIAGVLLRLTYVPETRNLTVTREDNGAAVPFTYAYWFAWQAFYPATTLWKAE